MDQWNGVKFLFVLLFSLMGEKWDFSAESRVETQNTQNFRVNSEILNPLEPVLLFTTLLQVINCRVVSC